MPTCLSGSGDSEIVIEPEDENVNSSRNNSSKSFGEFFLLIALSTVSCATVTPRVSNEEMKAVEEELKVKELEFIFESQVRINTIGHHIIRNLPKEDRGSPFLFTGLLVTETNDVVNTLFNLHIDEGVVVTGVMGNSPAMRAGVLAGDVLVEMNNRYIKS